MEQEPLTINQKTRFQQTNSTLLTTHHCLNATTPNDHQESKVPILSTTIKNFDTITRNNQELASNLNGINYLYQEGDSDSDSETASARSLKQSPFTHSAEENKKKTILLGYSRKNQQQQHFPPRVVQLQSTTSTTSSVNSPLIDHNVKKNKTILEKHAFNELKSQELDDTCFIANIIRGSPSSTKKDNPQLSTNTPSIQKKEEEIIKKNGSLNNDVLGGSIKSTLDEHKLNIEELEFLEITSSEEEEEISKEHANITVPSSGNEAIKETGREYFEKLLQEAKRKEPKEVKDYERMADFALEKSLESLKKTIDDVDVTKADSSQHISQRRRMYDSLKRGLGARDFMAGVVGSSEAADDLLSKIGLSPIAPKTPPSTPKTPQASSPKETKTKRTKEDDDKVLERLSKPRSHQLYRKNEEKSFTHSVAALSEEFLDRMKNFEEMKKSKLEELRSVMNQKRNQETSFSPRINSNSKTIQRSLDSLLSWQKEKNMKQERLLLKKQERELIIDCTFSPEISERSQKLAKKKPSIPLQFRD